MPARPSFCTVQLLLMLLLFGCKAAYPPAQSYPPAQKELSKVCKASPSWISNPTMPLEVAEAEEFCDFYQFSWQWFLAQASPANLLYPSGDRVFETNRLVDPQGGPGQCAQKKLTGRAAASQLMASRVAKPINFEDVQADGYPLYDKNGNILYYNMWYSPELCQATPTGGFVPRTLEIKVAWRVLPGPDPSYYTMDAKLPDGSNKTLGLVGFHLVNWTSNHPEMLWATFEHKSNAPLCDGSSATTGWSLASNSAAKCLAANPQPQGGRISPKCAKFDFNKPPTGAPSPPPVRYAPDEICRLYANGNQPGTAINGNDNDANLAAIQDLNTALVGDRGLLTALKDDNPMAVWKNYEMTGSLWTKGGAASGNPPVPSTLNGKIIPGDPKRLQRGSLELTNMTMETYGQGQTSDTPNCFGCHNYVPAKPLTVSHIATRFLLLPSPPSSAAASPPNP